MSSRAQTRGAFIGGIVLLLTLVVAPAAQAVPRCFGKAPTIIGTGVGDRIKGTSGPDVIAGLGGRDRIIGRGGHDVICGGSRGDEIRGKSGNDRLSGGTGSDILVGNAGNDRLMGTGGPDVLIGNRGNDLLLGGPQNEITVLGEPGMFGGPGDDVYNGGSGSFDFASLVLSPAGVIVDLNLATPQNTNEGIDTFLGIEGVEGTELNDVLIGQNVPSETGNGLFGLGGTDQLLGMDGNDVIVGDAGDDRGGVGIGQLNGGLGNDAISGGPGNDDLLGEAGNDVLFGGESEETTGDFGSGGPDIDDCTEIETPDPDPANACEKLAPRIATSRPAGWRTVLFLRRSR